MKIGVLSDTHNNLENLRRAMEVFRQEDIGTLIHCGDLTTTDVARAMEGFQVICAFGNGDIETGEIRRVLLEQDAQNYAGLVFRGERDGARIAVTHGHLPSVLEELIQAGNFDYIFRGHSHQHKEEQIGSTRVINPGALGGLHRDQRHMCIVDLQTRQTRFVLME